ncbi:hypothetical protein B0H13DRAFT_2083477 [Mycena leptocephala]|nr:hypothetical protein B0H13DRAFT_2083477 [Mycena leptocephala]
MPIDVVSLKRRKHNVTIYVGSDNDWGGRMFCFERGPHSLVIQTPELKLPGYIHFGIDPEADKLYHTTFYVDLEKIGTLIKEIEWGKTNWCYLVTRKDGSFRLHYKEKPILPITCPPWAPLIPEEDILYTKYITAEDREGLWNDKLVNCTIGWNDRWREFVDLLMKGHRLLHGLDVTFEVLGHIVRNGDIIGLMIEHVDDDRRVEYRDRAAVYAAVAKVQSKGLIIGLNETNIIIHKGKVRLLDAQTVRKFSEVEDVDATVARKHWQALSTIFDELRQHPNPMPLLRCIQNDAVPFITVPSPEKPLHTDFFFRLIVHITDLDMQDHQANRELGPSAPSWKSRPRVTLRPYTRQRPLLPPPDSRD